MAPAQPPTITAILINYNHAAYLPGALDAALNQTVPFDEVLIIDDCSTDNSVSVIEEHIRGKENARFIVNPQNMGVIKSYNKGLAEAKGEYIYFMSADDTYSRRIVEWCKPALQRFPGAGMASANIRIHYSAQGREQRFVLPFPQNVAEYSRDAIAAVARKRAFTFFGGGNVIRRAAILEAGGQAEALKWHADWLLYLLVACRNPFIVIPEEFICIRQAEGQYSHASQDWKRQGPVLAELIRTLARDYPDAYGFFRVHALLPTYTPRTLWLLLQDKELRGYLTPLLVWRLLTYQPMRRAGRLAPERLRATLRTLVRV